MRTPPKPNKNGIFLIALASLFLVMLVLYLAVLLPMFRAGEGSTTTTTKVTLPGEGPGLGGSYLMFPEVSRAEMASIEVFYRYDAEKGAYESYKFTKDVKDEDGDGDKADFLIDGYPANTYNAEKIAQLVVDAGYPTYVGRLDELDFSGDDAAKDAVYSNYGLSLSQNPAYYVLTALDGSVRRVYIGAETPDGKYYARLDGTDAVYILYSSLKNSLLAPLAYFIEPELTKPGDSQYAYTYINNFAIYRDSALKDAIFGGAGLPDAGDLILDPYVMFTYMTSDMRDLYHDSAVYAMMAPSSAYTANDTLVSSVLSMLPGLTGTETLKAGIEDSDFAEGGLLADLAYTIYYEMPYNITYDEYDDPIVDTWVVNILFISKRGADGNYTVGSLSYKKTEDDKDAEIVYNQIAKVAYEDLFYVEYSTFHWIEGRMFSVNMGNVAEMEFSSSFGDYVFTLVGNSADDLVITEKNTGFTWTYKDRDTPFSVNDRGYCDDSAQFRELYLLLLNLQYSGAIAEDTGMTDAEIADAMRDDAACMLTFVLTMEDGREMTYRFFPYSERHCMVSVTGDGIDNVTSFYTITQAVRRIASAARDLMTGVEIDSDRRF